MEDQTKMKNLYEKNIEYLKKTNAESYFKDLKQKNKQKSIKIDNQSIQLNETSKETADEDFEIINEIIEKIEKKQIEEGKNQILDYMKSLIKSKTNKRRKK